MKKLNLTIILVLLLAVLMLSMVACTPDTPVDPDDGTDDTPPTPDPITFTVKFDSKGGTGIEGYTGIEFGQTVKEPTTKPTKSGYIFSGWTLSNGDKVDFDLYTVHSNVTFFASWTAKTYDIPAYFTDENRKDVILDMQGNSVSEYYGDVFSVANSTLEQVDLGGISTWTTTFSLSYESTNASGQSLPVPTTTKPGDRFMYWYYYEGDEIVPLTQTLPQGSTKQTIPLLNGYKYDGSRTIYPMWYSALDNITVKFNAGRDDITISTADITIKEGDHINAPDTPSVSGFDFNKWTYISIDEDENEVVNDMTFYTDPSSHGTHITTDLATDGVFNLYANWTKRIEINSANDWTGLDTTDKDVQSANIYLMQNIDLGDYTTIFDGLNPFSGVFDGQGHSIAYDIFNPTTGYNALVGVNEGVIKGLVIDTPIIDIQNSDAAEIFYTGFVAGISSGTISGIEINAPTMSIKLDETKTIYAGGVAGINYGEISSVKIASVPHISTQGKLGFVGGIVGHNASGALTSISCDDYFVSGNFAGNGYAGIVAGKITYGDCSKISITGSCVSLFAESSAYAGGVAGYIANNTIEECALANCTVTVQGDDTLSKKAYAGGLVGEGGSAIRNTSLSAVSVQAYSDELSVAGGLVGVNYCEIGNRGQIQYTVATGSVHAESMGTIYVGGLCGQQSAAASSSSGVLAYVYGEFNVSATRMAENPEDVTVKIGKAFGSYDSSTYKNVYVADSSTISIDEVEYNKDDNQYPVTTHQEITEITAGFETIQNAQWIDKNLKLDSEIWIVTDGSYPTLKFAS